VNAAPSRACYDHLPGVLRSGGLRAPSGGSTRRSCASCARASRRCRKAGRGRGNPQRNRCAARVGTRDFGGQPRAARTGQQSRESGANASSRKLAPIRCRAKRCLEASRSCWRACCASSTRRASRALRLLLNRDDPNRIARQLHYLATYRARAPTDRRAARQPARLERSHAEIAEERRERASPPSRRRSGASNRKSVPRAGVLAGSRATSSNSGAKSHDQAQREPPARLVEQLDP
jgi:hypothetical protein